MSHQLTVELREDTGRRKMKKLRAAGKIPAVIYGLGEDTVSLSVTTDEINKLIHDGERIVTLTGSISGDAFIRDVQWDLYGVQPIHVDFTRVQAGQMIETTVSVEIRGVAPGSKVGGEVEQLVRELRLECPPRSMTDKLQVNVSGLELNSKITIADLELPEGSKALEDANAVVVQCFEKGAAGDAVEGDTVPQPTGAEPEVIGKKSEGEDGDNS